MAGVQEALAWIGLRLDDQYGARLGKVADIYVDARTGRPTWLLVQPLRFHHHHTLVPADAVVAGGGRVFAPYDRELIYRAPTFEEGRPLSCRQELEFAGRFGILARREAELAERQPGETGSVPANMFAPAERDAQAEPGVQSETEAPKPRG